jgi:hypothetical protein
MCMHEIQNQDLNQLSYLYLFDVNWPSSFQTRPECAASMVWSREAGAEAAEAKVSRSLAKAVEVDYK